MNRNGIAYLGSSNVALSKQRRVKTHEAVLACSCTTCLALKNRIKNMRITN